MNIQDTKKFYLGSLFYKLDWFRVSEEQIGEVWVEVFKPKIKDIVPICSNFYGNYVINTWRDVPLVNVQFRISHCKRIYSKRKIFTEMLYNETETFENHIRKIAYEYQRYMSQKLKLTDFDWISVKKNNGYYTFKYYLKTSIRKPKLFEICIYKEYETDQWVVSLCDNTEAVIEETYAKDITDALEKADHFYHLLG